MFGIVLLAGKADADRAMPVLLPITTFRSAPLSSAAMAAGCFRVMRRMETPGLEEASMPVGETAQRCFQRGGIQIGGILQHDPGGEAADKDGGGMLVRRP